MARTPTDPTQAQVWITKGLDELDFEFYFPQGPKGDPGGITLGSVLTTTDLNTIVTSGVYRQDNSGNATLARNYPANAEAGVLIVLERIPSSNVIQSYESVSQGGYVTWRRILNAGTWSPWRAKGYTRTDQTAGRAMYAWDEVNNREQLIYGDTGVRTLQIGDFTSTVVALTGTPVMRIRRFGAMVDVDISGLTGSTAGTIDFTNMLPVGFRPTVDRRVLGFSEVNGGQKLVYFRNAGSIGVQAYNDTADKARVWAQYTTTDAWPTTLPGTVYISPPAN